MKNLSILEKVKQEKGFTVVEVVVATLIFAIAATGLFAMVAGLQKQGVESSSGDVNAALVGKRVLENLRTSVDASTWNTVGGPFDPATNPHILPAVTVAGISYTPSYDVVSQPDGGRKVTLHMNW